ncbi:phospholipase-like protein [Trichoderma reesei QM6a]|uniref:Lysophospholipase n=2 Tax=Hypocrea jecorina TaxID=51453 RepID=G0RX90_HYPJQ|nr:phospholipase-like protein [Trichoderma reesei QM6a]EGR44214.1 phospholipase-like protein [Trichoderma reesei QM6a]ETR96836.1 lysophospholipase precursor [Trichoderma reesei RUT C-30]
MSRQLAALLAAAAVLAPAGASAVPPQDIRYRDLQEFPRSLEGRATDQSPKGYAPSAVDCPSDRPEIRIGSDLSPQEKEWLPRRRNATVEPIRDFLKRVAIPGFNSDRYLSNVEKDPKALPNIGLAVSGGGYRAMLNGAGAIAAWDSRSPGSNDTGNLGGLLQSATYLSGLSGGGWLVGSIFTNNFTTVQGALNSGTIWQTQNSILEGPEQYSLLSYYNDIFDDVDAKDKAGYDRSITDYWGRMLSYQLVNATNGGPGFTFSSIADDPDFKSARTPLPFLVADGRAPGQTIISNNSTVFDINPWEMGSSDPTVNGYVPLKYAGSRFINGSLPKNESCMVGFDNVGYIMGTSSSLFNQIVLYLRDDRSQYVPKGVPDFVVKILAGVLTVLGNENNDIADWTPNPFRGWNPKNNPGAGSERLTLVDGGEDLQNVPYHPHILQARKVDVVFSVDSSADTDNGWPDGASIIATYERAIDKISNGTGFPYVPGKNTFLNLGFNTKPVFFGCNSTNVTGESPLIVYLPNYPYQFHSNISTFQMSTELDERDAIVTNGWDVVTQGNSTRDANWPVCVGCAMLARSFERTRTPVPDACSKCFQQYCWNGTLAEQAPGEYDPTFFSTPIEIESLGAKSAGGATLVTALAAVVCAVLLM